MGTTANGMREFLASGVKTRLSTVTSPTSRGRFAQRMDQGAWSPLGDCWRLAFIHSAGLRSTSGGSGEFKHVRGSIGVARAQNHILYVLSPANMHFDDSRCASIHEALPRSKGSHAHLRLPAIMESMDKLRTFVLQCAATVGTPPQAPDIDPVLEELLTNVIHYAYPTPEEI